MKCKFSYIAMVCGILFLTMTACKKEKIEIPESNEPVFRADGSLGTESFSIIAGDNGAYMYTMTETVNAVDVFSGKLSDGQFSIELGIYDGFVDNPTILPVQNIGIVTPVFSKLSNQSLMLLSKDLLPNNQFILEIKWYVDDVFKGVDEVEIYEPGIYMVRAEITFEDSTTRSLSNELIVGYHRTSNCSIDFNANSLGNMTATLINLSEQISSVNWFVDNSPVQGTDILQTTVTTSIHNVKAEIHFMNGVVRTKEFIIDPSNPLHNVSDFTIFETSSPIIAAQDFNVRLRLEKNGKIYLSESADNTNSSLAITGVSYYGKNSNGKDVYKVSANVNAKVHEIGSLNTVPIQFSVVFGIEIP